MTDWNKYEMIEPPTWVQESITIAFARPNLYEIVMNEPATDVQLYRYPGRSRPSAFRLKDRDEMIHTDQKFKGPFQIGDYKIRGLFVRERTNGSIICICDWFSKTDSTSRQSENHRC